MKNSNMKYIGMALLSFLILFILYTIHFILVETVFKTMAEGSLLQGIKLLSASIWSILGGIITAKMTKQKRGVWVVAVLTFLFMMINYPSEEVGFFWLNTVDMVGGVLAGGLIYLKRKAKRLAV